MAESPYLTAPQVMQRFGISEMTLWRWSHDEKLGFPQPMRIRNRKFFPISDIEAWERLQMEARAS